MESDTVRRWHYILPWSFFHLFQIYVSLGTGSSKVLWLRRTFFRSCQLSNWSIPLRSVWSSVLFEFLFHLWPTLYFIVSQEVQNSSHALQEEKEEVKRRLEEATARVIQLEEDLIGVTQKGLQKETELDGWVQQSFGNCVWRCASVRKSCDIKAGGVVHNSCDHHTPLI